jgi:DHA1 family tetracycline resistance protein-like MFS transporter
MSPAPDTESPRSGPAGPSRAAFAFIFVTVLLDMLALGIIVPVLPKLIIEFEGGDSASAALYYGLFGTVWAGMQFLFSPVLGALSDRFGRRSVILLSTFGLAVDYFIMAAAPTLGWLFLGRVLSGITSASYATAYAYIADVTVEQKRAGYYGLLGAAFGIGFVLGPAVGGLLGGINLRLPFWVAGAMSLVGTAYGFFILPESLPPERRSPLKLRHANPLGSLAFLRARPALLALATSAFLYRVAHDVLPSLFVLYGDYRYAWSETTVGLVLAAVGVASMVVQVGLVGRATGRFGEGRVLLAGFGFGALGFTVYGLAPTGPLFLVGIPLGALLGLFFPSLQGILTSQVGPSEQGRLQGALASLMGIAGIIAPLLFTQVFAAAIGPLLPLGLPGLPFLLAATLLVVGATIAARPALSWRRPGGARAE